MSEKSENNGEILIVKMYSGMYLDDDKNIGHEAINLYKPDNDDYGYIYVCPYGWISKEHNDKVRVIFLTRSTCDSELELLAVINNPIQILKLNESVPKVTQEDKKRKTEKYIKYQELKQEYNKKPEIINITEKITYGGKKLSEIFGKNQDDDADTFCHITFKADNVIVPDEEFKNRFSAFKLKLNRCKKFIKDNESNYSDLIKFAREVERKCKNSTLNKYQKENVSSSNLIRIIRKENDELVFSNFIKYIFEQQPESLNLLSKNLGFERKFKNFDIIRERENNIDLFVVDNTTKTILVIENKIKSGIHGKTDKDGNFISQLERYKKYIEIKYTDYEKKYLIIAPDYNKTVLNKEAELVKKGWIVCKYSEIASFFDENKQLADISYYDEFRKAIERHTKKYDITFQEEMHEKFAKRVMNANVES